MFPIKRPLLFLQKKLFFFLKKVSYQPEFPKKKTPRLKLLSPQFHLPISLFPKQCQLLRFCPALVTAYQYTKVSSFSFSWFSISCACFLGIGFSISLCLFLRFPKYDHHRFSTLNFQLHNKDENCFSICPIVFWTKIYLWITNSLITKLN